MNKKNVTSKDYFVYSTRTTLQGLQEIAGMQVDRLYAKAGELQLERNGPLEFIYFDCTSDPDKEFTLDIALPVKGSTPNIPPDYSLKKYEDFNCLSYIHKGDLTNLSGIYDKLFSDMWNNSLRPTNQIREIYMKFSEMNSPDNLTEIQIGVKE